jgi:hypothetical protein
MKKFVTAILRGLLRNAFVILILYFAVVEMRKDNDVMAMLLLIFVQLIFLVRSVEDVNKNTKKLLKKKSRCVLEDTGSPQ